jgi:hypothetical protein
MKTIISLVMVLLPCMAFAATECHTVEYPDHTDAICVGDAAQSPASPRIAGQQQATVAALTPEALAAALEPDASAENAGQELPDVPPEQIVRNGLAQAHGATAFHNPVQGRW